MLSNRHSRFSLPIFFLIGEIFRVGGLRKIPPATLVVICLLTAIHLKLFATSLDAYGCCISAITVYYRADYIRLILAQLIHLDDWHLYYNCASLIWKGIRLESQYSSKYFVLMLGVFTILVNSATVALAFIAEILTADARYLSECAVGASGVIFALKVVCNDLDPGYTHYFLHFIPIKAKYAVWAELLLIKVLVPNSSFIGHLAGIIVGIIYCYTGILRYLMRGISWFLGINPYNHHTTGRSFNLNGSFNNSARYSRNNQQETFHNSEWQHSFNEAQIPPSNQDFIRQQRLSRFSRS